MAHTYTPTATFHPTLVLPDDGDKATAASVNVTAFQPLADNDTVLEANKLDGVTGQTYTPTGAITVRGDGMDVDPLVSHGVNVGSVLSTFALFGVGTGVTSGRADLTALINSGGFSVSSNRVTVPAVGTYEIHVSAVVLNTDGSNPQILGITLNADATLLCNTFASADAADGVAGGYATISRSTMLLVTSRSTQRLNVTYAANTEGVSVDASGRAGTLLIKRVA